MYICNMKTNVTLQSSDRELFGITIRQETKTQMLSITDLQNAYERARFMNGWNDRQIVHVLHTDSFKERLYHVLNERKLINIDIPIFMEMIEKEGLVKTMKALGVWKTTGRGSNKQVVADPYIWVLIAMELNPLLYAKVIIWLTDTLVFDRIEAGDEFLPMNAAIKSILDKPNYSLYARSINEKVFGQHMRGIRNLASAKELRKITDIEKFVTNTINMGIVTEEKHILKIIQNYGI